MCFPVSGSMKPSLNMASINLASPFSCPTWYRTEIWDATHMFASTGHDKVGLPKVIAWAANMMALMLDTQACWIVTAGQLTGSPPLMAMSLPGLGPLHAWRACPMMHSSTSDGSTRSPPVYL